VKDENGETPLHDACYRVREGKEIVLTILQFLSETSSRDEFRSALKNAKEWWQTEAVLIRTTSPSLLLDEELMASFEYNLSINRENNEKGAR